MYRKALVSALTLAFIVLAAIQSQAFASGGGNQYRVRANLSGQTLASGKAEYRERMRNNTLEKRFTVEVEDATPGNLMVVEINGTVFGMFVINELGIGELEYRTPEFNDDPGTLPIPDDFPHLLAGDVITVGPLGGVFANH